MFQFFKKPFYKIASYLLNSDFIREELWHSLRDKFIYNNSIDFQIKYFANPYKLNIQLSSIPRKLNNSISIDKNTPIFITSRFRSGSTFLWLLFRKLDNITAYYEPLNENRWFLDKVQVEVDPTHIGVNNYSDEFKGLNYLNRFFSDLWTYSHLYMTEKSYDYNLFCYIKELIDKAPNRSVLQFNRVDFRLGWIKAYFPDVVLLHIYRNPREQWMSVQIDGGPIDPNYKISRYNVLYGTPPLFYTIWWAKDLRYIFEFLEPEGKHPYEVYYYLWRLSYIWAKNYVHYSFAYEELVTNFKGVLKELFEFIKIPYTEDIISNLEKLNKGKITQRWKNYASVEWFEEIENKCDFVLSKMFTDK